jgi:hypothetical protein
VGSAIDRATVARRLCIALLAASAAGCSAGDIDSGTLDGWVAEEGEVGERRDAFAEVACTTLTCNAGNSCATSNVPACGGQPQGQNAIPAYGTASCPSQFVIQDTTLPTTGKIFPTWTWVSAGGLTQANCSTAVVDVSFWGRYGNNTDFTPLGQKKWTGAWQGGSCKMNSATGPLDVSASTNLKAVRATVSATLSGAQRAVRIGFGRNGC